MLALAFLLAVPIAYGVPAPQGSPFLCSSVSTYTAPDAIVTSVIEVVSTTTATEVFILPGTTVYTTTYSTTHVPVTTSCFSSGTTLAPTTFAPGAEKRATQAPAPTAAPTTNLGVVLIGESVTTTTFFNPFNPFTCTAIVQTTEVVGTTDVHVATVYDITTLQTTVTFTRTGTVVQPTPASYDGLNYYQYTNTYDYNHVTTGYGGGGYKTSDWRGNYNYDTNGKQSPNFESPGWPSGTVTCQLAGQPTATDCQQWTVVFQGFLFAQQTGTYQITAIQADNEVLIWGGDKAYRSYTDQNSDIVFLYGSDPPRYGHSVSGKSDSFGYNVTIGQLYPLTIIASNGQGPMKLQISAIAPDGTDISNSDDFLVAPCDVSAFLP